MKFILNTNFLVFIFFIFLIIILFFQFFFKELVPFPGNYLLAWYEPWKTEHISNGTILIAHKPVGDDIFRQTFPFKTLAADMYKKIQLPLWNPYNGAGMPFLATANIGLLDPFNILYLLFPYDLAWSFYLIMQAFLIASFTYMYSRKIGLNIIPSLFASISFLFSGFVITKLFLGIFGLAIALLPLLLYLIESYIQNSRNKCILFFPIAILLIILSTLPQISLYILLFTIFYFFIRRNWGEREKNLSSSVYFFLLICVGIGVSAIQIVPTIELFLESNINKTSSLFIFKSFLLPVSQYITLFIPNFYGNPSTYNYWGYADYVETDAAFGLIPMFFTFIAVVLWKKNKYKPIIIFFSLVILITLGTTIDWFFSKILFSLPIPIFSTSIPSRILIITMFCLSILAGIGVDQWKNIEKSLAYRSLFSFFLLVCGIFGIVIAIYAGFIPCDNRIIKECNRTPLRNTFITALPFFLLLFFLLYERSTKKNINNIISVVSIFLVLTIGLYNANKFLPFSPRSTILPKNSLLTAIKTNAKSQRVFGINEANIKTDFATYFRYYDPQYYHPLYIKRYGELIGYASLGKIPSVLPRSDVEISSNDSLGERQKRLLSLLNVKFLIYKKGNMSLDNIVWQNSNWALVKNDSSLPKVYFVDNIDVISSKEQILERLFSSSFNPSTAAIVEEKIHATEFPKNGEKQAVIERYEENNIQIKTRLTNNSFLVVSDNYYPGWKATIDGKETRILRTNYSFRGIIVPAGIHRIDLFYQPNSFFIGVVISFLSLLVYLGVIFMRKQTSLNK